MDQENISTSPSSAKAIADAFREGSTEHERLYQEAEARAIQAIHEKLSLSLESADRFNHMHLALTSILAKAKGLEQMMETAELSSVWSHRARSIQAVAEYAIAGLPEPIYPEGPPAQTESERKDRITELIERL